MDSKDQTFHVLMLPWLAHGHVSPFMELAKRLAQSSNSIKVYLCSTLINLSSIREQLNEKTAASSSNSIQLVELHLPTLPGLPTHLHTTKYLPPHLMPTLKQALDLAEPSFLTLLRTLTPDLLIYDFIQPWAPAAAGRCNIPAIQFLTTGAAASAFFYHYIKEPTRTREFPFPAIRLGSMQDDLNYGALLDKRIANGISDGERYRECMDRSSDFIAIKSLWELESKYIDYLSLLTAGKEIIPVGALVPDVDDEEGGHKSNKLFTEWLDRKGRSSVVFASFGSEYFMSEEEMEEIAHGLEMSGVSFIWVVRFPNGEGEGEGEGEGMGGGDSTRSRARCLPFGFVERVAEGDQQGVVVEGWAPQRRILAHPSVGGFLSHCGWSSVMEGMQLGVPMIALPLQLDQPLNAKLVVELGVGVEIKRSYNEGDGFERIRREEVAKGIRDVVVSEQGEGVRSKAKQMAEEMGRKWNGEIDHLLEKMAALCTRDRNIRLG